MCLSSDRLGVACLDRGGSAHAALVRRLAEVVGSDHVSTALVDRIAYSRDVFPLLLHLAQQGELPALPEAIVWPKDAAEVAEVVRQVGRSGAKLVPYGGGSGIVGGAAPVGREIVMDLKRLDRLINLDPVSQTVTVEAGIIGSWLEEALNRRGYTLGHYPQSLQSSTVGGWIAHRAAGVASTKYGKIEDMVLSVQVVLPDGRILETCDAPRAATGPDLKQLFLGAEGTLGIVTAATLAVRPLPEERAWEAAAFPSFPAGIEFVRRLIQRDVRPAILRLYDEIESEWLSKPLGLPGDRCLLLIGAEGYRELVRLELQAVRKAAADAGVPLLGSGPGERWWGSRLDTTALLEPIRSGGLADALEVSTVWSRLPNLYADLKSGVEAAMGHGGRVFGHLSHAYQTGGNLYMIFQTAALTRPAAEIYEGLLAAAFAACARHGAAISHHHGIGLAKARWLPRQLGAAGSAVLRAIKRALDPDGVLNPGKLLP